MGQKNPEKPSTKPREQPSGAFVSRRRGVRAEHYKTEEQGGSFGAKPPQSRIPAPAEHRSQGRLRPLAFCPRCGPPWGARGRGAAGRGVPGAPPGFSPRGSALRGAERGGARPGEAAEAEEAEEAVEAAWSRGCGSSTGPR